MQADCIRRPWRRAQGCGSALIAALAYREKTLKKLLDEFKLEPGLVAHWVVFGPNGREKRPEQGGVLRHYTRCTLGHHRQGARVKSIVNTFFVEHAATHPHNFQYRCAHASTHAHRRALRR